MPRHKDFEIWFDEETQRYRFSVEYWGSYGAKTLKEIKERQTRVRSAVAHRLKEIDRQNKEYYKKLATMEDSLKRELKKARTKEAKHYSVKYKELTPSERTKLLKMIRAGADELEIKNVIPVNASTISALRAKRNEHVREHISKDEVLSNTGRSRIIMPEYTNQTIGKRRLGDD